MDWTFLTALSDVKVFPAYGLLALVAFFIYTGRLVPSRAVAREVDRVTADRDARLLAKDEEIARTTAVHAAEVARAREAETQWREAWRESQDIAAEVRAQNRDLVDSLYFVRKIVGALPRSEGGDDT
ncbi:hypothetical protein HMPREF3159_03290 [Brachybacterium sp. HMSC06H03]|nr:hypothetical protein HMPREF3159_03290 [Brachybacterium sp. HMSC06H03]